jgi:hypothetical protein
LLQIGTRFQVVAGEGSLSINQKWHQECATGESENWNPHVLILREVDDPAWRSPRRGTFLLVNAECPDGATATRRCKQGKFQAGIKRGGRRRGAVVSDSKNQSQFTMAN